jgi:hypothetical protein
MEEYSTSEPSTPCHNSNDSELARIINCDLAINRLTTSDTAEKIWSNLNQRCIEKFGDQDHVKNDVIISDLTWACTTLTAYRSWNKVKAYFNNINSWIEKINHFCKSN